MPITSDDIGELVKISGRLENLEPEVAREFPQAKTLLGRVSDTSVQETPREGLIKLKAECLQCVQNIIIFRRTDPELIEVVSYSEAKTNLVAFKSLLLGR